MLRVLETGAVPLQLLEQKIDTWIEAPNPRRGSLGDKKQETGVTNNMKDFPEQYLNSFGLTAKTADDFLTDIIDLNPEVAVRAFREMVLNRKKPDLDEYQVLDILRNQGLEATANYLHSQL